MTAYLKEYMKIITERLENCTDCDELEKIFYEHKDKIAFMQHERIVHFLVTMMFAIIMVIFIGVQLLTENMPLLILIAMILILLSAYIKHYYFLENTVQEMYKVYDEILLKREKISIGKTENSIRIRR